MAQPSSSSSSTMVTLRTKDGVVFKLEPSIAKQMQTVEDSLGDDTTTFPSSIPIPNVCSKELHKIVEYLQHHRNGEENQEFDAVFLKPMRLSELKELLFAVHFLNVKGVLLDFLTQEIADRIQNKSVEFARKFFGVENDFTPEEEAKVREERAWTFTGVEEGDDYEDE